MGLLIAEWIRATISTVEPENWRRNFPWILPYEFWWGRTTTGWPLHRTLSGRNLYKHRATAGRPLNRSIGPRNTEWTIGIGLSSCRIGRIMTRNSTWVFYDGKVAWNCMLSFICFSYYTCISGFSRKKNRATSPPESEPTLSLRIY